MGAISYLDAAIQNSFNNVNNVVNVEGGAILTDTWIDYVLTVSNYIRGNPTYKYVASVSTFQIHT